MPPPIRRLLGASLLLAVITIGLLLRWQDAASELDLSTIEGKEQLLSTPSQSHVLPAQRRRRSAGAAPEADRREPADLPVDPGPDPVLNERTGDSDAAPTGTPSHVTGVAPTGQHAADRPALDRPTPSLPSHPTPATAPVRPRGGDREPRSGSALMTWVTVGDWGYPTPPMKRIGQAMGQWAAAHRAAFAVSVGDNFYPRGVSSPTDHQWAHSFEEVCVHMWRVRL